MSLRKVEFLDRIFKKLKCREEILLFLKDEKVLTDNEVQLILNENHQNHASRIFTLLETLQANEQILLVEYQWTMLPKELMMLTIVTKLAKKEFIYT
jgi:hypothetical protein